MNKDILNTGIQQFINENLNTDISSLLLKYVDFSNVDMKRIAEQIQAKQKAKKKLPSWYNCPNIYYPNKLNIEQTSSEITAQYKSGIIRGKYLVDLTGGLGVDSYYFAKSFETVTHCELNRELSSIAKHNFSALGQDNINCLAVDGLEFLESNSTQYDCIYLDPSRRDATKKKVFLLQDCAPDITKVYPLLLNKANTVLVKISPLVDISKALKDLPQINEIHIVAVDNQVKEMLLLLTKAPENITIKAVNIKSQETETFSFLYSEENQTAATYSLPLTYLYEPNAAILKSGGFQIVSKKYALDKLHPHTHLYTHEKLLDFPGRRFLIKQIIPYNRQNIKALKAIKNAHISIRNFPETVEQLRKKLKINDGGTDYLFFSTDIHNQKIALLTEKIEN